MIKIKHEEKFEITGRGSVYAVDLRNQEKDTLIQLANLGLNFLKDDLSMQVEINGTISSIIGIERFAQPLGIVIDKPTVGIMLKRN